MRSWKPKSKPKPKKRPAPRKRAAMPKVPMFRLAPLTVDEARYVAAIFASGSSAYLNDLTKALNAASIARQVDFEASESATRKMRPILDFVRGIP